MSARAAQEARNRARAARLRDLAWLTPLGGAFLLISPAVALFNGPSLVAWVFGVWAALIGAAFALSRVFAAEDAAAHDPAPPPPEDAPE